MPSKKKAAKADMAALPSIPPEVLEYFSGGATPMTGEQINTNTMALKKALIGRALGAELTHYLGYPPGAERPEQAPTSAAASLPDGTDPEQAAAH